MKFWPYTFHHALRMSNAFPEPSKHLSPVALSMGKPENFANIQTFGCRAWVRPPGKRNAKLKPTSRKGNFLGYVPHATRNILWHDIETTKIKIATHARFDEGMNDLPVTDVPPNVAHLCQADDGNDVPQDDDELTSQHFAFDVVPFVCTFLGHLDKHESRDDPTFGLELADDPICKRAFITAISKQSAASALCASHSATCKKLLGAHILEIDH